VKRVLANIALALLIGVALLKYKDGRLFDLDLIDRTESLFFDLRLEFFSKTEFNSDIFIVDIDDQSLTQVGRWPWRRDIVGDIVTRLLDDHGVRMVIFSFPLSDSDLVGEQIMEELKERFRFDLSVQNAIDSIAAEYDFDRVLAGDFDGAPVLLNYQFTPQEGSVASIPSPSILFDSEGEAPLGRSEARFASLLLPNYEGFIGNLESLQVAALASGTMTPISDADGIVRRVPLIVSFRAVPYESLLVQALRNYEEGNPQQLRVVLEGDAFDRLAIGSREIPVNRDGTMYVNYLGEGGSRGGIFQYIPAASFLGESAGESRSSLRGKIAVIGSSSLRLGQIVASPLNPEYPEAELVAVTLANLLDGNYLHRPAGTWLREALIFIVLSAALSVLLPLIGPLFALPVAIAAGYGVVHVNLSFWEGSGHVYEIFPFIVLILTLLIWNLIVGFIIEYRSTRRMQGVLGQYLPPALAKRMSKSKRDISTLKGEEKELSILFSDVRGFTSISEQFDPQALSAFMNQMLTSLSECIHEQDGTIDKYIGDAVMAFWGAPLDDPKHALKSVLAALEMQTAIGKLSESLEKKGFPPLKLGIGICTGHVRVGNMGSNIRLNYTVMGDSVNAASRLEGITKHYGVPILVSDLTASSSDMDGPVAFREVDTIRVKGKERPIKIYQPVGMRAKLNSYHLSAIDEFHQALEMYKSRDFENCLAKLYNLREQFPEDGLITVYVDRIEDLLSRPLAAEWEPIWNFVTK